MKTILNPTRGGPASQPNQDFAIELAKERNADLIFLYVSNVRFLNRVASPVLVDIEEELDEMGEFMLAMAQERAEKAGVPTRTMVRRGGFRQVLQKIIEEEQVQTVILGSPTQETGITTRDYLQDLTDLLRTETALGEMIIVREGEIVEHFRQNGDGG